MGWGFSLIRCKAQSVCLHAREDFPLWVRRDIEHASTNSLSGNSSLHEIQ